MTYIPPLQENPPQASPTRIAIKAFTPSMAQVLLNFHISIAHSRTVTCAIPHP